MRATFLLAALALAAGCSSQTSSGERTGEAQQAIQGGAVEKGLPNVGMLEFSTGNFGTATLITPRVVLTAAHVVGGNIQGFYVGQGRPILRGADFSVSSEMKKYGIAQKIVHPSYQCQTDCAKFAGLDLDMGLVLLDAPASEYVAQPLGGAALTPGMTCSTTGYGNHVVAWDASDAAPFVKEKRTAQVRLLATTAAEIEVEWVTGISDHGDSGGPLFCGGALVGTTAYHVDGDDQRHRNELYQRADVALPWIEEQLTAWGDETLPRPPEPLDAGPAGEASAPAAEPPTPSTSDSGGGCSASRTVPGDETLLTFAALLVLAGLRVRRRAVA